MQDRLAKDCPFDFQPDPIPANDTKQTIDNTEKGQNDEYFIYEITEPSHMRILILLLL